MPAGRAEEIPPPSIDGFVAGFSTFDALPSTTRRRY